MKRLLYVILTLSLVSLAIPTIWGVSNMVAGNDVEFNQRFITKNGFNWKGIFSPVEVTVTERSPFTKHFSKKVFYNISSDFVTLSPKDGMAEIRVANEFKAAIDSSKSRVKMDFGFNYDGENDDVYYYHHANAPTVAKTTVIVDSMIGTASPEARSYGFLYSLMPGNTEPENAALAKRRLDRTSAILSRMGYKAKKLSSKELQLPSKAAAYKAAANPEMLDSMRYVQIHWTINGEYVQVTTQTAPVLLFALLGLIGWLLSLLPRLFKRRDDEEEKEEADYSWLWNIVWFLMALFVFLFVITFLKEFVWIALMLLAAGCIYVMYQLLRDVGSPSLPRINWRWLLKWLVYVLLALFLLWWIIESTIIAIIAYIALILFLFYKSWDWIIYWWRRWLICWSYLTPCWKKVFIFLVLIIGILITIIIQSTA